MMIHVPGADFCDDQLPILSTIGRGPVGPVGPKGDRGDSVAPTFANPIEWDGNRFYAAYTIVMHNGDSYTSKVDVPVGISLDNEAYWVHTGDYNAQVELYRRELEKISSCYVNHYGADKTGVLDSSDAIEACINNNLGKTIYFSSGKYKISRPIKLPHGNRDTRVSIDFCGSTIAPIGNMNNIIEVGTTGTPDTAGGVVYTYIKNGIFLCTDGVVQVRNCIYVEDNYKDIHITNCTFRSFKTAIIIGSGNLEYPADAQITDCLMVYSDTSDANSCGITINGTDCKINDVRIYGFHIGVKANQSGCFLDNVHVLSRGFTSANAKEKLQGSCFMQINAGRHWISNSYCDTMQRFVEVNHADSYFDMVNCFYASYMSNVEQIAFYFSVQNHCKICIENTVFNFVSNSDLQTGFKLSGNDVSRFIRNASIVGCTVINPRYLVNGDILTKLEKNSYQAYYMNNTNSLSADSWTPIYALICPKETQRVSAEITVTMYNPNKLRSLRFLIYEENGAIVSEILDNASNYPYSIGVQRLPQSNVNGNAGTILVIYVKASVATTNYTQVVSSDNNYQCYPCYICMNNTTDLGGAYLSLPASPDTAYNEPISISGVTQIYPQV